jgi:hypothetical protein
LCLGGVALYRGEHINSIWLVLAAACTYLTGYRFYAKFIAARVMALNDKRATPAERLRTAMISSRRTSGYCSGTISPRSPAPARWSVPCWRLSSVIFRGPCGSSLARCSAEPFRIS